MTFKVGDLVYVTICAVITTVGPDPDTYCVKLPNNSWYWVSKVNIKKPETTQYEE